MDPRREIEKIDYLLDEIARSVEQGEVPLSTYETLAPRYLARRRKLAESIETQRVRQYVPPPAATPAQEAPAPIPARPIDWTKWFAWAGALLVVIAAAIFTVYKWETFSPEAKLLYLVGVTSVFYVTGEFVRVRMGLRTVGIAITTVGAAMILFDGWILITAFGLSGPWPWAAVLGVSWVVYWLTELRVSGTWFGAMGALAQVGWWWLLGAGLNVDPEAHIAAMALIALAWSVIGRLVHGRGRFDDIASILRWGAPALAGATVAGMLVRVVWQPPDWAGIAAAAVMALAAAAVLEREETLPRGLGAVAAVPLLAAIVLGFLPDAPALGFVAALAALAAVCFLAEMWRARYGYGVVGLVSEAFFWYALVWHLDWPDALFAGVFATLGASWLLAAWMLERHDREDPAEGVRTLRVLTDAGGWALLIGATLSLPLATGAFPYFEAAGALEVAVAVWVLAAWTLGTVLRRNPLSWAIVAGGIFYCTALAAHGAWPDLEPAWHALILLVPSLAWARLRRPAERFLGAGDLLGVSVFTYLTIPIAVAGVALNVVDAGLFEWSVAVLLGAVGLLWAADAALSRVAPALSGASVFLVAAILPAAGVLWETGERAGLACAAGALILVLATLAFPRGRGSRWWAAGATVTATFLVWFAAPEPGLLALGFLACAAAWVLLAFVACEPMLVVASAILACAASVAGLAWAEGNPWATVLAVVLLSGALVAPVVAGSFRDVSLATRGVLRILAAVGITYLLAMTSLGVVAEFAFGLGADIPTWTIIDAHGIAVLLVVGAAYLLAWTGVERTDLGSYPASLFILAAYYAELTEYDVSTVELYVLPLAVCVGVMGWVYASRREGAGAVLLLSDLAAAGLGLGIPLFLSFIGSAAGDSFEHALWAGGAALAAIAVGVAFKVRIYFIGGIITLLLDALWMSRDFFLALPKWILIGAVGVLLLVLAVTWDRRKARLAAVGRAAREALADWR